MGLAFNYEVFHTWSSFLPQGWGIQLALIYMNMGREVSRRLREADERLFQAKVEALLIGEDYLFKSVGVGPSPASGHPTPGWTQTESWPAIP
jgi:hypothetical protein